MCCLKSREDHSDRATKIGMHGESSSNRSWVGLLTDNIGQVFSKVPARMSTPCTSYSFKGRFTGRLSSLCVSVALIGAVFRLSQYAANRSLWLDEAKLALNIVDRSFLELVQPLDYGQGAPVGFLFIEKLLIIVFGNTDYVLRIVSIVCGLAAIWVMYVLSKRVLVQRIAVISAVTLFSVSDSLIYYASEAKQYSSDVLVCLLVLLAVVRTLDLTPVRRDFVLLGALGALAVWFSHPAAFVLAGSGAVLGAHFAFQRNWRGAFLMTCVAGVWFISFAILYLVSLRQLTGSEHLLEFWGNSFMPLPPWQNWGWFVNTFRYVLHNPIGISNLYLAYLAAILLGVGGVSLCLRRWQLALMLLLPILLTLIASALHKYPFSGRLLLFLVPIVLLILAEGIGRVESLLGSVGRLPKLGTAIALAVLACVTVPQAKQAVWHLWEPRLVEEIKPAMTYLKTHKRDKDTVYVYYGASEAFRYYSPAYLPGIRGSAALVWGSKNRKNPERYWRELEQLRGRDRVWILFSHIYDWEETDEEALFLEKLERMGRRLDEFDASGSALYLYGLSVSP